MKIPISWLKQYVSTRQNSKEIAKKLTAIGHMQDGPIQTVHGDQVIDLEVRQNRSDCLAVIGVARELAAIDKKRILYPEIALKELTEAPTGSWTIKNQAPDQCLRFTAVEISNISIKESPPWLKKALLSYGMDPINNVVDITNYVMIEFGQPLHAFDKNYTESNITIRRAKNNEPFTVLGGRELSLTEGDLVIANNKQILALAGIIGGNNSGVSDTTTSIILEAANYNQASIRRSSIRHTIRTEASLRLEKFLSPALTIQALSRAIYLIEQICGGKVVSYKDDYPSPLKSTKIKLEVSHFEKLSGISLKKKEIISILSYLEFHDVVVNSKSISSTVPHFRTDVIYEEDLIEEILRIHGYGNIPELLPKEPALTSVQSKMYDFEEQIRDIMTALQFDEHITEPLTDKSENSKKPIKLQNSLTSEKQQLRTSLQSGLMIVKNNYHKHRKNDIRVYEIGKIYYRTAKFIEERALGILLSHQKNTYANIKGILETLAHQLGRAIGENDYKITPVDKETFYAEISTEKLFRSKAIDPIVVFTSPPKLVLQDLSLKVPEKIAVGKILHALKNFDRYIFEVKLGENPQIIEKTYKTLFIRLSFRSPNNENIPKEILDDLRNKILKMLETKYSAKLQ